MKTRHKVIFGNCMSMQELSNQSVHFIVTSPPYFNAPFDYKGLFENYNQYLGVIRKMAVEAYRVLQEGRIFALNIDDMLVDGVVASRNVCLPKEHAYILMLEYMTRLVKGGK